MQRHQGEPILHHHLQAGTSNSPPARPPLVDRSAEMDRLAAQLSRAARRQGCAMFLVGEAGIGKTRLAHEALVLARERGDRKSTRLNSSHGYISYAVFCLKKKKKTGNEFNTIIRNTYQQAALAGPSTVCNDTR